MRRLKTIFLICSFMFLLGMANLFAVEYTISTSRGPQVVVLPDGQDTLDAFLNMSQLYLEERFDHEDLLAASKKTRETLQVYLNKTQALTKLYEKALTDKSDLVALLEKKSKTQAVVPVFGLAASFDNTFSADFGVLIFEKFQLSTVVSYPMAVGLRVGILL